LRFVAGVKAGGELRDVDEVAVSPHAPNFGHHASTKADCKRDRVLVIDVRFGDARSAFAATALLRLDDRLPEFRRP
jgi:hypothetical protein